MNDVPVAYILFDLLWLDGHSLHGTSVRGTARATRRARAQRTELADAAATRSATARAIIDVSKQFGLEGVMAKRLDSIYEPGKRSRAWLKLKNRLRQEFVVGRLATRRGRPHRQHRLVARRLLRRRRPRLRGQGRQRTLGRDRSPSWSACSRECARDDSPFTRGRVPKGVHFVEPVLVVEVEFTEWTSVGNIRQPTFLGTREDKDPRDVVREVPE